MITGQFIPIIFGLGGLVTAYLLYKFVLKFPAGEGKIVEMGKPKDFFDSPKTERCKLFLNQILQH